MSTRTWTVRITAALALSLLPLGLVAARRGSHAEPAQPSPAREAARRVIAALGTVEPASELRELAFETSGVIGACEVAEGARVAKGQRLATLRNHEAAAEVSLAERELAVARAEHAVLESGVHEARIRGAEHERQRLEERARYLRGELERKRALFAKELASTSAVDLAATELQQAERALAAATDEVEHLRSFVRPQDAALASSRVDAAQARLELARARLAKTELRAPLDGVVLELLEREGEAVSQSHEPVLLLAETGAQRVRAEVDERWVHALRQGQTATVGGRNLGGQEISGRVVEIERIMGKKRLFQHASDERKDRDVLEVLIELPPGTELPIGLEVDVQIAL